MQLSDNIGDRGENAVERIFLRPINGHNGFLPLFLGAKAPVFDFCVFLLSSDGRILGPHFYLQVKASTQQNRRRVPCSIDEGKVTGLRNAKTPVYIAGVDLSNSRSEEIWVTAIPTCGALNGVKKDVKLDDQDTLVGIYKEVYDFFDAHRQFFRSSISGMNRG
jgi:hypothetical protein